MADKTVVALYDDPAAAIRVIEDLRLANLLDRFRFMANAEVKQGTAFNEYVRDIGPGLAAGFDSPPDRVGVLGRHGVPRDDAEVYAEGVRRGGVVLFGPVRDDRVDETLDIVERHGPVDLEHRGTWYRQSGWAGYDVAASDYDALAAEDERRRYGSTTGPAAAEFGRANEGETSIPITEEEVHVGKREVSRGGVRVRSYVVETPVAEDVRLRDETVSVERRPVDRPAGDIPPDAFRERTVEATETDEEPVVARETRVTEEVVVRKDVEETIQRVEDTERRTEVDIEDTRRKDPGI